MTQNPGSDQQTFRRAATYTLGVVGAAVVLGLVAVVWMTSRSGDCTGSLIECAGGEKYLLVFGPSALLLLGGLGAFVRTYRVWKDGGRWQIWQGAGWFLFVCMLTYFVMSTRALVAE